MRALMEAGVGHLSLRSWPKSTSLAPRRPPWQLRTALPGGGDTRLRPTLNPAPFLPSPSAVKPLNENRAPGVFKSIFFEKQQSKLSFSLFRCEEKKMTLQWAAVATFLYAEIGLILIFCLPFIPPQRQEATKLLTIINQQLLQTAQCLMVILLLFTPHTERIHVKGAEYEKYQNHTLALVSQRRNLQGL